MTKAELKRQINNRSTTELVDVVCCGFNCPPNNKYSCGCKDCNRNDVLNIYYRKGEMEVRFTVATIEQIKSMASFYGPIGCLLPRDLRPRVCLQVACEYSIEVLLELT